MSNFNSTIDVAMADTTENEYFDVYQDELDSAVAEAVCDGDYSCCCCCCC